MKQNSNQTTERWGIRYTGIVQSHTTGSTYRPHRPGCQTLPRRCPGWCLPGGPYSHTRCPHPSV